MESNWKLPSAEENGLNELQSFIKAEKDLTSALDLVEKHIEWMDGHLNLNDTQVAAEMESLTAFLKPFKP